MTPACVRAGEVIVATCDDARGCRGSSRIQRLGEPEVEHLDRAVRLDLDVRGLDVPVHDPLLVRRLERVGDLPGDGQRLVEWKGTLGNAIGERGAFHQFHYERLLLGGVLEPVDGGDVRVIQLRERPGLPLEAGEAVRVLGHRGRQHFERHIAMEFVVVGAIHVAHPSRSEMGGHFVRAEPRAWSE